MAGVGDCVSRNWLNGETGCRGGLLFLGVFGYVGFRIWEIIDIWVAPIEHNRRYRMLKSGSQNITTIHPVLTPLLDGGGVLALKVTF